MRARQKAPDHTKANGVHYTPPELAAFLAEITASAAAPVRDVLRVLDPACGDGGLLVALANAVPRTVRRRMIIEGYETDAVELERASAALSGSGAGQVVLLNRDFLSATGAAVARALFDEAPGEPYDVVIANPPYVRTQVLGAQKARALARKFGLTGRVDLYHAFAVAITSVLKPGGILGLLTSNRFLTIKSGASLRQMFSSHYDIEAIYDLGDTRLFSAAVLPVILVARKGKTQSASRCAFHRIYEHRNGSEQAPARRDSILAALRDRELTGVVETPGGVFAIQRGRLAASADVWSLSSPQTSGWLETVAARQVATFGDLAKVRVGIKSTADEVFVRDDWQSLPIQPEAKLLRPLLTHREAGRWVATPAAKRVLYPHEIKSGNRLAIDLADYPRAAAYFQQHEERLSRRTYVLEAGRKWYEIWVPHNPRDWAKPKIAYPDIAEMPRFFLDSSGAIIQGDCYWITLNERVDSDWLLLMLAVANSTFITKYYDAVFHNKLYAGRRRFMTQYVARFPLPDLSKCQSIVGTVSRLLEAGKATEAGERKINRLVWEAFGLPEEIPWQGDR